MSKYKVWCKNCYKMMREQLNTKYGNGNWCLNNLEHFVTINMESNQDPLTDIFSIPSIKIEYNPKNKNGSISSRIKKATPFSISFCPFCGKPISETFGEVEK